MAVLGDRASSKKHFFSELSNTARLFQWTRKTGDNKADDNLPFWGGGEGREEVGENRNKPSVMKFLPFFKFILITRPRLKG